MIEVTIELLKGHVRMHTRTIKIESGKIFVGSEDNDNEYAEIDQSNVDSMLIELVEDNNHEVVIKGRK